MFRLPPDVRHFRRVLTRVEQDALICDVADVLKSAPLYRPEMPRTGQPFSVEMTNCGSLGWVSDRNGYRYQQTHPVTGLPWPEIPPRLLALWHAYGRYRAPPEACLVNHYDVNARLGSHVDADEPNRDAPVVSISLGCSATFHIGGTTRTDPKVRLTLRSGDIVVFGGRSRSAYHGIDRVLGVCEGVPIDRLIPAGGRINLTLRRVTPDPE